ncbi:MAG: endonuclease containing a URI domain protein [Candidatus Scalindua rubra]|uniref:Endonuclease containing a URI domain protein n=1 Tax=Candidatus Scalindua rubra TaxID=1872076 RepID=A0A1E3XHZ1_9BACT|nr:MAG: endonuclease containing a URI domain protein [Candidatus Scalindua rubra]
MYYVYVLRNCKDGRFYTGYTADLKRRVAEHKSGILKSTSFRLPVELVYYESSLNIKDAMRREKYLKATWGKRYIRNRIKEYLRDIKNIT